ncbi:uncharacterized protein Tco025E_00356 [Trypanosoma conorhini]|uniref:Nop14-like family protein n=1 Tax=Trypanosoma conorhini TaxID=83891 RepID=A0A422QBY5_9TRYP|nr:uncharacterized protein Tco025E_00356 [Trypanosoma conorhini]RNF27426.1 hypothetical protein Tco025E_00356 [Trypanosoma conorhini]
MRRTASHAKIVQQHERRKSSREAKASAARFGSKQSRFQLRQEEVYAQEALQPVTSPVLPAGRHGGGRPPAETSGEPPATFSRFERPPAAAESGGARGTTATATFGLAPPRRAGMHVADSRSTRRAARFRLEERGPPSASASPSLGAGLLGATRRTRDAAEADADAADAPDDDGGPPRKKTREERFREVLASSKEHRAQAQREREGRAQQTTALDAAFNGVMHLLERRDKAQEERAAFARVGTPQVRALLQSFRENHVAKTVSLRGDGSFTVAPLVDRGTVADAAPALDKASMALLQKVRAEAAAQERGAASALAPHPPLKATAVAAGAAGENLAGEGGSEADDFDRMMHAMRGETRRAHAGERTLTEEEAQAQRDQQALLQTDRSAVPPLAPDATQLTRAEWLSRGGDHAYQMQDSDDDDDGEAEDSLDISSAADSDEAVQAAEDGDEEVTAVGDAGRSADAAAGTAGRLEELLSAMEAFSREADGAPAARAARSRAYHALLRRLHQYAREHVLHTAQTFRLLLIEAQRSFLRHGSLDRATLLLLHATSRIFPMTDYRHEVATPFLLFLSSALLQMRLRTPAHAQAYAVLAGLLCESVLAGGKYCAEAIIAPLNLIALQVPRSVLEPVRLQGLCVPFPLVERGGAEELLLRTGTVAPGDADAAAPLQATLALLETDASPARVVRYAYRLLSLLAEALRGAPALPCCLTEPFCALHARLVATDAWQPSESVRGDHDALLAKLTQLAAEARERRTPLAMRSFRPRPIRQFEPLLQEGTTTALKNEVRAMKREMREDHKRVVRHVQAEANVGRRQRERAAEAAESQRAQKYRELMGSLQAQQHVMNTVDGLLDKARSKKRKSITGGAGGGAAEDTAEN